MNMMENVKKVVQELILPELGIIKAENQEIKTILQFINQRVNDTNIQLVDQSRRMDETNKRIDEFRMELKRDMSELRIELKEEISMNTIQINDINKRMDRLYEVIVRRDEHEMLGIRVSRIDQKIT
ncbi:hypothetical protein HY793_02130, partial [Candidatus Desantisbacteria bacterium]|nr:hypothetical protein [Candidatus Desantisbacteria bacterium]